MRKHLTSSDVLESVKSKNSGLVIARAVAANAMAKSARSLTARNRAYKVKTLALEHGIRAFPDDYALSSIEDGGRFLGIGFRRLCALHVRTAHLSAATQSWVASERTKIAGAAVRLQNSGSAYSAKARLAGGANKAA